METDLLWHLNAKCLRDNQPTSFFYPNLHGISGPGRSVILRQIADYCRGCQAFTECKAAGEAEEHGAWAGNLRSETLAGLRVDIRRAQRAAHRGQERLL